MNAKRLVLVACVLPAALFAGCGSSSTNGERGKPAATILSDARNAATSAGSVHVSGTVNQSGRVIGLDLDLKAGQGGKGSMTLNGSSFKLVRIGSELYINASAAFYHQVGVSGAALQVLNGRWLKSSVTGGDAASFAHFTDIGQLFSTLLPSGGALVKGGTATSANGQKVVILHDQTGKATLDVSLTGKPYPVAVNVPTVHMTFSKWNAPVTVTAPAGALDVSQLH